jgi:hypothetical protein
VSRTSEDLQRDLAALIEKSDKLMENVANLKHAAEEIRRKSKSTKTKTPMPKRPKSK